MSVHIHTYAYVCTCIHICMDIYIHACVDIYIPRNIQTCIYTPHNAIKYQTLQHSIYSHTYLPHALQWREFIFDEGESIYIHVYTLQHTATHCNVHTWHALQHGENLIRINGNLCIRVHTLQHTATHCNIHTYIYVHCNTLQHTATCIPDACPATRRVFDLEE